MTIKRWLGALAALALFLGLLIMPAVRTARERARRTVCTNNLKQIGLAMHGYHDSNGCFPAAATVDDRGRPLLSWRVLILPFMGEDSLYREFRLNEPWYSPHNRTLLGKMPAAFACPLNEGQKGWAEMSTYQVIVGPQTMFTGGTAGVRRDDVTDGTANTILVVTAPLAMLSTRWPLLLAFIASKPALDRLADRVAAGQAPRRLGAGGIRLRTSRQSPGDPSSFFDSYDS
jgi:hypothetical protein